MTSQKLRYVPLVLAPTFLAPVSGLLHRQDNPHLLLGLSSSFWAGTIIGVALVSAVAGIYLMMRPTKLA